MIPTDDVYVEFMLNGLTCTGHVTSHKRVNNMFIFSLDDVRALDGSALLSCDHVTIGRIKRTVLKPTP